MPVETVVAAAIAVLTALFAVIAWFYRRGRSEQSLSSSVDRLGENTNRNTAATVELAAQVGGLRETLERHGNTLTEHHWRIKALEDTGLKVTVERAAK